MTFKQVGPERTIYKYEIKFRNDPCFVLQVPLVRWLDVAVQCDVPIIWAVVDTEREPDPYLLRVYGTGHPIDKDAGEYLGSFLLAGGRFAGHLFCQNRTPEWARIPS